MIIDKLIDKILELKNPTVVGLDTILDYLPEDVQKSCSSPQDAAMAIVKFNYELIERLCTIVPCVKVQVACYEMYGVYGMQAFLATIEQAKKRGMFVIADVKRNDIGSTCSYYSNAYLGKTKIGETHIESFPSDFATINGYLGVDGIEPFLKDMREYDKGIFVLVKTSNSGSGQLQDLELKDGRTVYEAMADLVNEWGSEFIGKHGYSSVGAVVGATHPAQAKKIREKLKNTFFLIPGYGAQGGKGEDIKVCFDEKGLGGIVNNSRGILTAYKTEKYKDLSPADAAYEAAMAMKKDLCGILGW